VQRCEAQAQAQASRRSVKCVQIVAGPPSCDPGPNAMDPRSSLLTQQPGMLYGTTYANGIHKAADANPSSAITVADTLFTRLARVG
jgi:hypothetical protein